MKLELSYQKPNYDGLVVIGAGLPRTGTLSMRTALGQVIVLTVSTIKCNLKYPIFK